MESRSDACGSGSGGRKRVIVKKKMVTCAPKKAKATPGPATELRDLLQKEREANDVVVKEFPVYLSKTLANSLTLIQYPTRPATVSTQNMEILETELKPNQNKLRMKIRLDPDSENYDPQTGHDLAEAAAGLRLDDDDDMPETRPLLEEMTLESTDVSKQTDMSRYAIGVLRKGVLTLTPFNSVVQMRPVYPHLDAADKARSAKIKEGQGRPEEEEDEKVEKVQTKFRRNKDPFYDNPSESYLARKKDEEEDWLDLEYVKNDLEAFDKLFTSEKESPFYVHDKNEYLNALFPSQSEYKTGGDKELGNISFVQMRTMQLQEQLRVLLSRAQVLKYKQIVDFLRSKLSSKTDDVSLLKAVQIVAILVQGCWVVKSEVLYGADYKSGFNGVSGEIMQRGRDAILMEFTKHRYVDRQKTVVLTKLPQEEVAEILGQVSVLDRGKGWEFMGSCDDDFLIKYPEVVERQGLIWQLKRERRGIGDSTTEEGGGGSNSGCEDRDKCTGRCGRAATGKTGGWYW